MLLMQVLLVLLTVCPSKVVFGLIVHNWGSSLMSSAPSFYPTVMKRNVLTSSLTKAYIESKVSQIKIMSYYLDIDEDTIKDCIEHSHLIPSVFRDDDYNGSMGFTINAKGRLKVRDFGGFGYFSDVYEVVAYVLSLAYDRQINCNNKQDFYFILTHIAYTFRKYIDGIEIDDNIEKIDVYKAIAKGKTKKKIIELAPRSWNKYDKDIWGRWGIDLGYLNTNFVIPVDQYYIDRKVDDNPKYTYTSKDPCYAYMLGQNRQGVYLIKLYFPLRKRNTRELKFITNCNVLEGLPNLELDNYDYILITKSSKDRLSIGCHLAHNFFYGGAGDKLNIGVINLPSENYQLKENEYDWLSKKLAANGMLVSLLDFDSTGRGGARYMQENYGIPYIFITRGELGLPDYKGKDFAELHDYFNVNQINQFIKETISYVEIKYRNSGAYYSDADRCYL